MSPCKRGIKPCKVSSDSSSSHQLYTLGSKTNASIDKAHEWAPENSECAGPELMLEDFNMLDFLRVVEHRRFNLQRIHVMELLVFWEVRLR